VIPLFIIEKLLTEILSGILTAIAMIFVTRYFRKRNQRHVSVDVDNYYTLTMPKAYKVTGIIFMVLSLVSSPWFILSNDWKESSFFSIALIFMFVLGAVPFLFYKNHYLKFNDRFIEVRSLFGNISLCQWNDINGQKYNVTLGVFYILLKSGKRVAIHEHLVGLDRFKEMLHDKTNISLQKKQSFK